MQERIELVRQRDGDLEALQFTRQTYQVYRTWLYGKNRLRDRERRQKVLAELLECRRYLSEHDRLTEGKLQSSYENS